MLAWSVSPEGRLTVSFRSYAPPVHADESRLGDSVLGKIWGALVAGVQSARHRLAPWRADTAGPAVDVAQNGAACLFCAREDESINRVILRNRTCYVRRDNFPAADGHVEIVPKRHVVSFFDLTRRELDDAFALLKKVRHEIAQMASDPDGYTIGVNEGEAAGRTVDHLHIHVIPRRKGDVDDPRGGIRRIFPHCNPDAWAPAR